MIYVNDLPNGLKSKCKLLADDTSLFSVVHDVNTSASDVNKDLKLIIDWAFKWKVSFNPDPSNQAKTDKGILMSSSKFVICDSKKSKFIKKQEASGLLSNLGLKKPLRKIPYYKTFCFKGMK